MSIKSTMKEIKDYLHLYLGCKVIWRNDEYELVQTDKTNCDLWAAELYNTSIKNIKPILRPLSDMTEEEFKEMMKIGVDEPPIKWALILFHAETTRWLLSKDFDLFQLIEAGLAIDKTTLNK